MYRIELDNLLFQSLIGLLEDGDVKTKILENKKSQDGITYFEIDIDTKIDLIEFVEDKQLEIGFVNEDYLNEDGRRLQKIYDEIYWQTN